MALKSHLKRCGEYMSEGERARLEVSARDAEQMLGRVSGTEARRERRLFSWRRFIVGGGLTGAVVENVAEDDFASGKDERRPLRVWR
jgi:hypothetical protein